MRTRDFLFAVLTSVIYAVALCIIVSLLFIGGLLLGLFAPLIRFCARIIFRRR